LPDTALNPTNYPAPTGAQNSGDRTFGYSAIDGEIRSYSHLFGLEKSSDPANPPEGTFVIWMSDGTGSGDDGDILIKVTAGAVTVTGILVDHSALV
jgi:hypothetical protein